MKYANEEFCDEMLERYAPHFGIFGLLERYLGDWTLLSQETIDGISDIVMASNKTNTRRVKAKQLGTILKLDKRVKQLQSRIKYLKTEIKQKDFELNFLYNEIEKLKNST